MSTALEGITVVDLTSHLSGPYCAMILGDQGADVIKIERPGKGDDSRHMPPFVGGESAPFMLWSRNKRSVVLDLKAPADLERCRSIIAGADVLVENFRPGTAARLGLGYEDLEPDNPGLVYCSISGFGQSGPYRERGGFDLVMQGMAGLMSVCGPPDGPPFRQPPAISDVTAGMNAAIGVLCALQARHRTGRGQRVDVSLFESALSLGVYELAGYFATGERPERIGQAHRGGSPYQVFRTADGWITFGASPQHLWQRLCAILGCESLADDPRFATNADRVANNDVLVEVLQEKLATRPSAAWLAPLEEAGIPAGPVLAYDEALSDPHTLARDMVIDVEHPAAGATRTIGTPIKLSATPGGVRRPAPLLGEHTEEVLGALAKPGAKRGR